MIEWYRRHRQLANSAAMWVALIAVILVLAIAAYH